MAKKKKVVKDKNIDRFIWKNGGDVEIIQSKTKKKKDKK